MARTRPTAALCPDCGEPIGIASFAGESVHLDPMPAWRPGTEKDRRQGLCFLTHRCRDKGRLDPPPPEKPIV